MRLAAAHCVWPGTLLSREINRVPKPDGSRANLYDFAKRSTFAVANGIGLAAANTVHALEVLTKRTDLRYLTLLPWHAVLSPRALLRDAQAWCPHCYAEWARAGTEIHTALLWALKPVTVCVRHGTPLVTRCPSCGARVPHLLLRAPLGYCPRCNRWLGEHVRSERSSSDGSAPDPQTAAVRLGELIASAPHTMPPLRTAIAATIGSCIKALARGNAAAFARLLHVPKNTLWMWQTGKILPELGMTLRICDQLDLSVVAFLTGDAGALTPAHLAHVDLLPAPRGHLVRRQFDERQVRSKLLEVLRTHHNTPPSMQSVAAHLHHDERHLRKRFPDLCRAISARYMRHVRSNSARSVDRTRTTIRQVVVALHREGRYPSRRRVETRLPNPGCFRNPAVRAAWYEALRELGLRQ